MFRNLCLSLTIGVLASSHSLFAQVGQAPPERISEPIIVNGQPADGVVVVQNGAIQSQTCPAPEPYVAADQSSSGWACFEASTGMWLLHAQPPAQGSAPQQAPIIIYSDPTVVYVPAPVYTYAYGYYPFGYPYYGYPYVFGPRFGIGFGFGFRAPVFVGRPFFGRPFAGRPVAFGFRSGVAVGRVGRR